MRTVAAIAVLIAIAAAAAQAADAVPSAGPGVASPARARVNWMLKCQGCHRPDASGSPDTAPAMAGQVARFLSVPGGREYLARVPGVSTAALPDDQLAELLNWSLLTFDRAHVPPGFEPYTAEEIGVWRKNPLRTEAPAVRAGLIAALAERDDIMIHQGGNHEKDSPGT